jgi:hypothetical protein
MCVKTVVCMLCTKLNTCLYYLYIQCTNQWHTTWNYTQTTTNEKLSVMNDKVHQTLSRKISNLRATACKDTNYPHKYNGCTRHSTSTFKFRTRVQNLTTIRLSCEEPDVLQLGFQNILHDLHALNSGTLPPIWKVPSASLMSN